MPTRTAGHTPELTAASPAQAASAPVRRSATPALARADRSTHETLVRQSVTRGDTASVVRRLQHDFGNRYTTEILRAALAPAAPAYVPRTVEGRIVAARGGGQPLDPAVRGEMEARYDHDFSGVRIHTDGNAADAATATRARAFALGSDVFFGRGEYSPGTRGGRDLIAHELAHVVQTAGAPIRTPLTLSEPGDATEREADAMVRESEPLAPQRTPTPDVQRQCACGGGTSEECEKCAASRARHQGVARSAVLRQTAVPPFLPDPTEIPRIYWSEIFVERFDLVAQPLVLALTWHPRPNRYIRQAIDALDSSIEDNVGAEFVSRVTDAQLDKMAQSGDGRATMNVLYEAIITGDVSKFEREQANRILFAKARRKAPENYLKGTKQRPGGGPTRIFPLRFMGILPRDDAPLLATLDREKGTIRVTYPVRVMGTKRFAKEFRTIPNAFTVGEIMNPSEIVGIKDYESGGETLFLPALALLDYSNRAIQSTGGKIIDVSMFAATFGTSGAVTAGGRFARVLLWADRAANVIQIASVIVNENRDWIIEEFPNTGPALVRAVEIANSAAAIYGFARLGHAGYEIVKDMRAATKAAREEAAALQKLSGERSQILTRLDDEANALAKQAEAEAAKAGQAAEGARPQVEPAGPPHAETPSAKPDATKPQAAEAHAPEPARPAKKSAKAADEIHIAAVEKKIPTLRKEVEELKVKASKPENIREPANRKFDAEMETGAGKDHHTFEREKATRKWCRHSNGDDCFDLGRDLNAKTDAGLETKRVQRETRTRKEAQEAVDRVQPAGREPGLRRDDPRWSKQSAQAEENRVFGAMSEDYLKKELTEELHKAYGDVRDQVRIRPYLDNGELADFYFIADHVASQGEGFVAFEGKLSRRAPLTPNQQTGYPLLARNGGKVIGKNAPHFPNDLGPTPSLLARPTMNIRTSPRGIGERVRFWFDHIPAPRPRPRPRRPRR